MRITIEVINVSAPIHNPVTGGKGYYSIEVAYKSEGKVQGQRLMDFTNKEIYVFAQQLVPGKTYTVKKEKNAKGYWQWVEIVEGSATVSDSSNKEVTEGNSLGSGESRKQTGRVTGSNYETPEERAKRRAIDMLKQRIITRQSSVGYALEAIKLFGNGVVSLEDLFKMAEEINNFVWKEEKTRASEAKRDLSTIEEDIPF